MSLFLDDLFDSGVNWKRRERYRLVAEYAPDMWNGPSGKFEDGTPFYSPDYEDAVKMAVKLADAVLKWNEEENK